MNKKKIWHSDSNNKYYYIPEDYHYVPGGDILVDLEGTKRYVDLNFIVDFEVLHSEIIFEQKKQLESLFNDAKEVFIELQTFSSLLNKEDGSTIEEAPIAILRKLILTVFAGEVPALFDENAKAVEAFEKLTTGEIASKGFPEKLLALFPEEDQETVFKEVFSRLQALAGKIDERVLNDKENPGKWVEVLYRELFQDEIKQKEIARKKRIEKSVEDSIADGLRKRGITPSADFKKEKK